MYLLDFINSRLLQTLKDGGVGGGLSPLNQMHEVGIHVLEKTQT